MPDWPAVDQLPISEHQQEQLCSATAGRIGCLTGGPGTGKSTVMGAYASRLSDAAFVAPTGRAAVRLEETMREHGYDFPCTTIHRLLTPTRNGHDGDGWSFYYNRHRHLPFKYIVCDECFPAGTPVDTPGGQVPIESLVPGSKILNACGTDSVLAIKRREVDRVCRITISKAGQQEEITCSANHPFFSTRGWVFAEHLEPGDSLVETRSALRLLWKNNCSETHSRSDAAILQPLLLHDMVASIPRVQGEAVYAGIKSQKRGWSREVAQFRAPKSEGANRSHSPPQSISSSGCATENFQEAEIYWPCTSEKGWKWTGTHSPTRVNVAGTRGRVESRTICLNQAQRDWLSDELQARPGEPATESRHRIGWFLSRCHFSEEAGQEEGCEVEVSRVVRVEIYESTDTRLDRFRDANGKLRFYDIEATRHPSFSVKGLLVHNSSMNDCYITRCLLEACGTETHVLFVGDPDQLPPVGKGRPFLDMIASGRVPHGHFSETHRFAGRIATVCAAINAGVPWESSPAINLEAEYPENLLFVELNRRFDILQMIGRLVTERFPSRTDDVKRDVQVIVPLNEGDSLGRKKFNRYLQQLLNANGQQVEGVDFRYGDKVVCLRNGFRFMMRSCPVNGLEVDKDQRDSAANGEIGTIEEISRKGMAVSFEGHSSLLYFPRSDWDDISLAYALTCHKAQGGQWPFVIPIVDDSAGARLVCSRSWWYTAFSRGKQIVCPVGRRAILEKDCRTVSLHQRRTHLIPKLMMGGV